MREILVLTFLLPLGAAAGLFILGLFLQILGSFWDYCYFKKHDTLGRAPFIKVLYRNIREDGFFI